MLVERLLEAGRRRDRVVEFQRADQLERYTFAELFEEARRVARRLEKSGVGPGRVVGVVGQTTPTVVTTLLAVWMLGATPTVFPPPPRFGRGERYQDEVCQRLRAARVFCLVGLDGPETDDFIEPCGLIQFSSGTTGEPLPVALPAQALVANVGAILQRFPGPPSEHSCVSWLPLFHDMGLIGGLLSSLLAHGNLTLLPPEEFVARPFRWLEALTRSGATTSPAPNFALAMCLERVRADQMKELDLRAWQLGLLGSETVQAATVGAFQERFASVGLRANCLTPVYGLAEATLAVTFSCPQHPPAFKTTEAGLLANLGPPLKDIQVEIRSDRVWVKSPSLMREYLGLVEKTAATLQDGWLDTGDLGFLEEGELFLHGRAKDVLIFRGRNHDPVFFEQSLFELADLKPGRAAAFSIPDQKLGTETLVVVAERRRRKGPAHQLAEQARRAVISATGLVPAQVHVVNPGTLPTTSSGKIRRAQTREQLLEGALKPVATA